MNSRMDRKWSVNGAKSSEILKVDEPSGPAVKRTAPRLMRSPSAVVAKIDFVPLSSQAACPRPGKISKTTEAVNRIALDM